MDLDKLENLIRMLEKTSVSELSLEEDNSKIHIVLAKGSTAKVETEKEAVQKNNAEENKAEEVESALEESFTRVESPIVGNYYSRPSPDAEPFVYVGKHVKKGDVLCIVEAMKFMNEIEAPVSGVIEKIFLSEGQIVEYGELLFLIRAN